MGLAMPQCKCAWEFVPPVAPQRTWVGLTDEEIHAVRDSFGKDPVMLVAFARAIEAKLKEKNAEKN
jgi:hypothetical protein